MKPKLQGIDHIHLYVNNKQQAVNWYSDILGFRIHEPLKLWDIGAGPLTIEDESGTIHLALFERDEYSKLTSLAFKTDGQGFIAWKDYLEAQSIQLRIADHQVTWSMYFNDPFGHSHEITTNEYDAVRLILDGRETLLG